MLYVYTKQKTERLNYIIAELLGRRAGTDFFVTDDVSEFCKFNGAKINYSESFFEESINIKTYSLLFENTILQQNTSVNNDSDWNKLFFKTDSSDIPFDIFSASFYLLSRYEEYLPHEKDEHERFDHRQSLAFKNDFIEIPLVDIWAEQLKMKILEKFPQAKFIENKFRFVSTIDIDFAYKYKGIGIRRRILKFGKSLLQFRLSDIAEQLKVTTGAANDPYNTYDFIDSISDQYKTETKYFLLMKSRTAYDKNILTDHPLFIHLIKLLNKKYSVGLHPSYYSENKIAQEKLLLEKYTNKSVTISRQHFLKFTLPQTYQELLLNNLTDDYSMGYSGISGFRASTCFPFSFFDLSKNESTSLTIHPTIVMDVTLKNAQQLSPENAIDKIRQLMNDVKKVNGTFISLWHNSSLCEDNEWKGWKTVFAQIHRLATTPYN